MTDSDESATVGRDRDIAAAVGRILKEVRDQQRLSQEALAKRMDYKSHTSLVAWERGHTYIHEDVVRRYASALGLSEQSLVDHVRNVVPDWNDAFSRTGSRSQASDFRSSYTAQERDVLSRYGRTLYDVTHEEPGNFTEITRYVYLIAEDDQDVVIEEHETTVPGDEPMRWRRFGPGARLDSGSVNSFKDLQIQAWRADSNHIEVLPLTVAPQRVELVAFFLPPVKNQTIRWYVEYVWPGLWNPLRSQGRDDGVIGFRSFTTRAEIILVPPRPELAVTFASRTPEVGEISDKLWSSKAGVGLSGQRWSVDNPSGTLQFTASMQNQKCAGA